MVLKKKQNVVVQSTAETEYVTANVSGKSSSLDRKTTYWSTYGAKGTNKDFVDKRAAIAKDSVFHGKTKHFHINMYHLREEQKMEW